MSASSIFNDVIGPVMRGPSSSHSAAGCRIGLMLRDLMGGDIKKIVIDYDPNGSLVTTHESQGTDMGLYGGLLGWHADDERMENYREEIINAGIEIEVNYKSYGAKHPNTYQIEVSNDSKSHRMTAISKGGGMIEIQKIDGAPVSVNGGHYELLIYGDDLNQIQSPVFDKINPETMDQHHGEKNFIGIKSPRSIAKEDIQSLEKTNGVKEVSYIKPVLPILNQKAIKVPYLYAKDMLQYGHKNDLNLWELGALYEARRGDISITEVKEKMQAIVQVMDKSIQDGVKGTEYKDRILPCQSVGFKEKMNDDGLLNGGMLNTILLYVTAMMEVKSSMGVIVAAPTAGSCGALPGALLGAAKIMKKSEESTIEAMLAAGMIGVFISEHSTFAAEVGGCQAECGAGSSMAAAGLVTLAGGTLDQAVSAASMALQNSLGMICDPVANRVEAPCLGKNVMAASNALSCANMALAGYEQVIPLDEVIKTMWDVGNSMAHELRCTGLGGLSTTPSSKAIEERLNKTKYC